MNETTLTVDPAARSAVIVRTSLIGVAVNVLLAAMKAVVGLISGSIAVVLDAVNNLSDALSSVVTILGAKLSAKRPDKKHPLGYGRIEYFSSLIVAALVLYAGLTSLVESVKKIITPAPAEYSVVSLVLIAAAVVAKLLLGRYVKAQGKKVDSGSLIASGSDASFDAILSASVLLCAIIFLITNLSLEAYVGLIISGFIIKAGVEMMLETVTDMLGRRTDPELSRRIKALICEEDGVLGAYDLILNNYGPGKEYGSVHMELADTLTAVDIDRMTRSIQNRVYRETGVILTGIGVYSVNTRDAETVRIRSAVTELVLAHPGVLQMHGFYLDSASRSIRFDTVFSFDTDVALAMQELRQQVLALYPDYSVTIAPDLDVSD